MYTKLVAPLATLALTGVMMTAAAAQVNAAEAMASSQIISSLVNPQAPQATTQPVPIEQGDFVGTFTLTKFVNDQGHLYAVGVVSGTNTATGQSGSETVTLPVTHASNPQPSSATAGTALAVFAQRFTQLGPMLFPAGAALLRDAFLAHLPGRRQGSLAGLATMPCVPGSGMFERLMAGCFVQHSAATVVC